MNKIAIVLSKDFFKKKIEKEKKKDKAFSVLIGYTCAQRPLKKVFIFVFVVP